MIGQTISHYQILEKLGEGGMGVVYKAQDTKLDRVVALKFLPPSVSPSQEEKARFVQEAKAASALDHPNICTIYEIDESIDGQLFIAMAYYEGKTLDQNIYADQKTGTLLLVERSISIAIQIAEGLQAAHEMGIIHRDIKSSNIIVTKSGQAKIMDFGLARRQGATKITKTGATVGTVHYMSPEQARGEKVDGRSDIWSLGVVLYEMVAGRLPFESEYHDAVTYSILNEEPKPLTSLRSDVPMELERIVKKALEKNPAERYQSMADILVDLRKVGKERGDGSVRHRLKERSSLPRHRIALIAGAFAVVALLVWYSVWNRGSITEEKKSIAVLPFQNLSDSKGDDYFSDGITEDIITHVSKIPRLKVISRTSVMGYKNTTKSLREIGKELGVATVLEGSVRRSANRVRIVAQLIDAENDAHLWSETYDKELTQIFEIQSDVAQQIASQLRSQFLPWEKERVEKKATPNVAAYDLYLRGRYYYNKSNRAGIDSSIVFYQQAVERDSSFALGYASLALAYHEWFATYDPNKNWEEKAFLALDKAFSLDSNLAEAYHVRGSIHWNSFNPFRHEQAVRNFKHALSLNPNLAGAYDNLAAIYGHLGILDRGLEAAEKSVELDPGNIEYRHRVGQILLYQLRYEEAFAVYKKIPEIYQPAFVHSQIALLQWYLKREEEAFTLVKQVSGSYPEDPMLNSIYAVLLAARGDEKQCERRIQLAVAKGKGFSIYHHVAYHVASAYSLLKKNELAIKWLHTAADEGFPCYSLFEADPTLDPLRQDTRFISFMEKLKKEWERYKAIL